MLLWKLDVIMKIDPLLQDCKKYIDEIYENGWLTNNGPLVQRLEKRLAQYLGVKNIILVSIMAAASAALIMKAWTLLLCF